MVLGGLFDGQADVCAGGDGDYLKFAGVRVYYVEALAADGAGAAQDRDAFHRDCFHFIGVLWIMRTKVGRGAETGKFGWRRQRKRFNTEDTENCKEREHGEASEWLDLSGWQQSNRRESPRYAPDDTGVTFGMNRRVLPAAGRLRPADSTGPRPAWCAPFRFQGGQDDGLT